MNPVGLEAWVGRDQLKEEARYPVPTIRLDTFLNRTGIRTVEFLKVDAQGADLAVVRSAGSRLKDIQKISLEVQTTPAALYEGGSRKDEVLRYLESAGFRLTGVETQSHGQEENLTFERVAWSGGAEALEMAKAAAFRRPLVSYPGWTFGADWDNPDPSVQARRKIWEHFNERKLETPFIYEWYDDIKLNLYLGNDLSRQLFIGGCTEPNEFAFLDEVLGPGMVFIDGGANDGLYSLFASRRVGDQGQVWAFEPSSREFDRLEQNLKLNQAGNVRPFPIGLADRNGKEELAVAGYEHEGQNTLGAFVHQGVELQGTEQVVVRRLDDLAAEEGLSRIDVIKLDVEGAEKRALEGARGCLSRFRPIVLFEALDEALQKQGSSRDELLEYLTSSGFRLFTFDERTGRPAPVQTGVYSANIIALPEESALSSQFGSAGTGCVAATLKEGTCKIKKEKALVSRFVPARAYWNQRSPLANARDRIRALSQAVNHSSDLLPYQWAQLMSVVLDYDPDLVLELGRGKGNSTCAFTEAANLKQGNTRVLSLCLSDNWERETVPKVRTIVPKEWFKPLQTLRADILQFDYELALADAHRIVIFWDAHGFDIAECVLGEILPVVADREHLVIMHDMSDARYSSDEQFEYGQHGLWKGNNWSGPRLKLGFIDSAVEQSIAALDFTTRNQLTLDSADHSFRTNLTPAQQSEMQGLLGELFETQGHWFYFTLNERTGPYKFPRFERPKPQQWLRASSARA
jgi:FkbM family methyltransferase